ncbi:hypothetical protein DSM104443_00727 [Usitatibacter rugosus]|uniref:DUF4124 domain-containing protein n=1 Tax=Usitatibacter rugosus TaxID=2732067 RepID=A0A6M4GS78_9PROT|nr:hypothetical protein DSM104443_00727 [Usitatibacter rugosus]
MPRRSRPGVPRLSLAALALLVATAIPFAADAKLYKLVDKNGKVTYGDKVPKGFDGEVTEIAIDAPPPPAANPPPSAPRAFPAGQEQPAKRDINTERKVARAKFQSALDAAREKLAAAKKALADGGEIAEDEFQVIQQRIAAQKDVPPPRSNCFQQPGAMVWICPVQAPGEKYRDRQKSLEDAVSAAEAEVAAAEDAYRRGTD